MSWRKTTCPSCSAVIIWAVTAAGKRTPVDVDPSPNGTIALSGSANRPDATTVSKGQAAAAAADGVQLRTSHWATCRRADRHRRRIDDDRNRRAARQGDLFGPGAAS